ncbi:MAG: hypothetical protein JXA68_03065 [Ignavibacteriales bacterium]|nr:hypothetical protein [Ignavibacteriales bacterium]
MKRKTFLYIAIFFLMSIAILSQPIVGDYRTVANGNWSDVVIWEVWGVIGTDWSPATTYPTASNANTISIYHSVNVNINLIIDQTENEGEITVASGITLTVANGTGLDLSNSGTITNLGTITNNGTIGHSGTGIYNHARNGGTIPAMEWGKTAPISDKLQITGLTDTPPTSVGVQDALNTLEWNCTGQTIIAYILSTNLIPSSLFNIASTNNPIGKLLLPEISGKSNITINQGIDSYVQLQGNIELGSVTAAYNNNGVLDCSDYTIGGTGNFSLNDNATIEVWSDLGINGHITVSGTTSFGHSNYIYKGGTQVTGSYLPTYIRTLERACYTKTPQDLTLTNNYIIITNELTLTHGRIVIPSSKYIELEVNAVVSGSPFVQRMVILGGNDSFFRKKFSSDQETIFTFPIGTYNSSTFDYEYTPADMNLEIGLTKTNYIDVYCDDISIFNLGWTYYLDRYWYVNLQGDVTYEATFTYVSNDLIGGDDTKIKFGRHTGSSMWDYSGGYIDIGKFGIITDPTNSNYYFSGIQQMIYLNLKLFLQGVYK